MKYDHAAMVYGGDFVVTLFRCYLFLFNSHCGFCNLYLCLTVVVFDNLSVIGPIEERRLSDVKTQIVIYYIATGFIVGILAKVYRTGLRIKQLSSRRWWSEIGKVGLVSGSLTFAALMSELAYLEFITRWPDN